MQAAVVVILHTKWDGRWLMCFYLEAAVFVSILPQESPNLKHRVSSEKLGRCGQTQTNMKLNLNVAYEIKNSHSSL